ncbi:MAG: iron ABC transporter substrate-binding protein [Actinomycetota bacterium]
MSGTAKRLLLAVCLSALVIAACSDGSDDRPDAGADTRDERPTLTVYTGREEEFVADLFDEFTEETGIETEVRYGDSAELAATLVEEGDASPADVFFSQDAGPLGAVDEAGLLDLLPTEILDRVDPRFRADDGDWVGTSGRGRVAVYNTETVDPKDLPDSIFGFADPEWKGRLGIAPTNSSFQAFVSAMTLTEGEETTRRWLEQIMANDPTFYEDNGATTRAVAAGEVDAGLVNHYYKYEVQAEDGKLPIENHYFEAGDPGAMINTAGVGVLVSSDALSEAEAFVDYLTSPAGQEYFATRTWEYPTVPGSGVEPVEGLIPLERFRGPDIDLSDLGAQLQPTLNLLAEVGML